jgi:hypothetical protein
VAVDRFGTDPLIQKKVDIPQNLFIRYLLNGNINPQDKMLKGVHIVF